MINDSKTAFSMLTKLKLFSDNYNLGAHTETAETIQIIPDGMSFDPSVNDTYITEKLRVNKDFRIGLSDGDSDIQRPIYEIKVFSPKDENKWPNIDLAMLLKSDFNRYQERINGTEQKLTVESIDVSPLITLESTLCTVLSVNLSVIASNK